MMWITDQNGTPIGTADHLDIIYDDRGIAASVTLHHFKRQETLWDTSH